MEDSRFDTMSTDTNVDFDLMDELLSGGCWLETNQEGSDFLQPTTSSSNSTFFFNSSYFLPTTTTSDGLYPNPLQNNKQDNPDGSSLVPRIHTSLQPQAVTSNGSRCLNSDTAPMAERFGQSECQKTEGSFELADKWWIEPNNSNSAAVSSVKARLIQALKLIKDSIRSGDVLIQIWIPVKRGGKQFLITTDQPFTSSQRLECYRNASMRYQFPAEEGSNESVGLPGRVFLGKVPEWTPDVRFFSSEEYPRIDHAQRYDVRGTLALPIFERCSRSCLGVVEVVMTTQKVNYRPELENVCRALEAVNLRGSEVASPSFGKVPNVSYQAVLPEIHEVLRAVCETHRLPLAQTWVPCILQGKEGCRHSDENYARCVSTVDSACCVTDPRILGFHEACSEHHLFRGQGVAGRAFTTNQPCFSSDITSFSKKDYPLSHYARMFGLRAAVAIRLRSLYTGTSDYVLELFLPVECCDSEEQKMMLSSLSNIIQRVCQSLRVVTDKELQEDTILTNIELAEISNQGPNREQMPKMVSNPSKGSSEEETSWITQLMEVQRKGKSFQKEEPTTEGFKVTTQWNSPELVLQKGQPFGQNYHESGPKDNTDSGGDSSFGDRRISSASKTGEKRRTKMEKTISLQVLRQYFAGSLKDAAKSIGVCPTTLKRICRQHGITRWPSRKIKKVGHSLRKLQVVIDSVQGAEGAFQIGSIYANFPELTSPNLSGNSRFSKSQANDQSNLTNVQPEGVSSPQGAASKSSSSSGSQSSNNSSLSCSSENQQIPATTNLASEDALMAENTGSIQKRTCSVAEMHSTDQENSGLLARSQSHRCVTEHPSPNDSFPPLPSNNRVCRDRSSLRVKVTYGEEKVRFSLQLSWGFSDLQEEIAKRFYIDDMSRMDLKYLDDDSEWVLLTCDADLEECMDIYKSSQTETIKLTVNQASHPNLGSSLGSTAP